MANNVYNAKFKADAYKTEPSDAEVLSLACSAINLQ